MTTTAVEMKLELIHIPVSDVDRARDFYVKQCGWELITDHVQMGDMRIVQIVPPGSGCAILMGRNIPEITDMPVGVQKGIHLVVRRHARRLATSSPPTASSSARSRTSAACSTPGSRTPTATRGCCSSGRWVG